MCGCTWLVETIGSFLIFNCRRFQQLSSEGATKDRKTTRKLGFRTDQYWNLGRVECDPLIHAMSAYLKCCSFSSTSGVSFQKQSVTAMSG